MPKKITNNKIPSGRTQGKDFHTEFLNSAQKMAWSAFQQHDVLFLTGPAGTGKTYLAMSFAIQQILSKEKSKIVLTRPVVESGESLGFLPGDLLEKINPYLMPMFDCMDKLLGKEGGHRDKVNASIEVVPLAFMRGRSFENTICILDEAQNASYKQLKMFLTRFGDGSKIIVTGDPKQSDLVGPVALSDVMSRLSDIPGIGLVEFKANAIVRHPLVGKIIENLERSNDNPKAPKMMDLY